MTYSNLNQIQPRILSFRKKTEAVQLQIRGQGVFIFEHSDTSAPCTFQFCDTEQNPILTVEFTMASICVTKCSDMEKLIDTNNKSGLEETPGAYYWFSLDAQNHSLQAGIGEARKENTLYTYTFESALVNKKWLEHITGITITNDVTSPMRLLRDPITDTIPLNVYPTEKLTMAHIASNKYMPVANLSSVNQKLYNCISGKNFVLNDKDFPDFSKAIEYSINTPGCWCYETLKAKSTDFSDKPNPKETYLRITLNKNNGESPGIPYVMEIWPVGHYSPIHNHGGANAIIRVLEGSIHVTLFSFLGGSAFGSADFKKNDVTWISPTLNQVHQLHNLEHNKTACITIQCYMYESDDSKHYDYFDYIDAKGVIEQFDPNSDMNFLTFKETIRTEWNNKLAKQGMFYRFIRKFKQCVRP